MPSSTTHTNDPQMTPSDVSLVSEEASFAETALKLSGKSDEEARRTGAVDKADEQVESLFAPRYQTINSPIHRAVWDQQLSAELFAGQDSSPEDHLQVVMEQSLEVVRRHRKEETLLDDKNKIHPSVLRELGEAGYWGVLVDRHHGGSGAPFVHFAKFVTQMSMCDPTIAGLASVHGCIGAVDPLRSFGNSEQQQRFLPSLASGERLSGFALTEPCAGSDLTALRTTAKLDGDHYILDGEKLFITNAVPGNTVAVVCQIEDKPSVLIVDLPDEENHHFQVKPYGLYPLHHLYNQGLIFRGLRVPASNLIEPSQGDGLTVAYHGLNRGRIALCAVAAGTMRVMMANMIPWAKFRRTYGAPIAQYELVRRRLGHLAGLIVGSDALVNWCSSLLDNGYRGEMECIVAKIFGSEAQKEAAIDLFMKTHGGRSFLHGHLFGDYLFDFLAPCIYEGEGEMLGMAFFKSLIKQHAKKYFEPVGKTLHRSGIKQMSLLNPRHMWQLKGPLGQYAKWYMSNKLNQKLTGRKRIQQQPAMSPVFKQHVDFATDFLEQSKFDLSAIMEKHQLKLADRQCLISEISQRIQQATIILSTSLYATHRDEIIQSAADVLCQQLTQQLKGQRPSHRYYRKVCELGAEIADGGFQSIAHLDPQEMLMPYNNR